MSWPVVLSELAESDIAQVFDYYETERERLGVRFMLEVEDALEHIRRNPLAYGLVIARIRRASLKRFPYALWFTIAADNSVVVACLHHKRDNPKIAAKRARQLDK